MTTVTLTYSDSQLDSRFPGCIILTRDGLQLVPFWSENQPDNTPVLLAEYQPWHDKYLWQQGKNIDSQDIQIQLQSQLAHEDGARITISKAGEPARIITLPAFMQLQLAVTESIFTTWLYGDDTDNLLIAGNTAEPVYLTGRAGEDTYLILPGGTGEITINNNDELQKRDILQLSLSVEQITLHQDSSDLIISPREGVTSHPRIRIKNFLSDERWRHLSLRDSSGELYLLDADTNHVLLHQGQLLMSNGDDRFILHAVVTTASPQSVMLNAMAGDDLLSAQNITTSCIMQGGTDNDWLRGGKGSNRYLFSSGDGVDNIMDDGGMDIVQFISPGITPHTLWLSRVNDDLQIRYGAGDCVTVKEHFVNENSIELIDISGWQLSGSSINRLVEIMANFPFDEQQNTLPPLPFTLPSMMNSGWVVTESL